MVNWNLLIKPSETVEEAWTLPQLKAALKSRAVVFNKREHMTVLFEKLLEWNRTEYPCMDASQKLPPRDLKISRWGLDQIRVALFFRGVEFEPSDTKQILFASLMASESSSFPPAPSGGKRRRSKAPQDSEDDSSGSEDQETLFQMFLADRREKKKNRGNKRKAGKDPVQADSVSSAGEESDSATARGTTKRKPKKGKRTRQMPTEDSDDNVQGDDDLFAGLYSSPKAATISKSVVVSLPYAEVWEASFQTIVANDRRSQNFKTLVHTTAAECEVDNVLFLYSEKAFYLYRVYETDSSLIKVALISGNSESAPFANCRISIETSVTGLSATCVAKIKAHFQLSVNWPTDKHGKDSFRPMTDMTTPAASKTKTSESESEFTRAIRSVLRDEDGPSGASKKSTPRGQGLTEAAAGVLSRDADKVLKTGNMVVFTRLYYLAHTDSEAIFWSLEKWRCQIQPAHLLQMVKNVASVDIRLFAYTADVLGTTAADRISLMAQQLDDKPGAYAPRLDLLDGTFIRMEQCLRIFACTVDVLFCLHQEIRLALQTAIIRVSMCARALNVSPGDTEAPVLLLFLVRDFQLMVSHVLGPVLGENHASMALVVDGISNYPDMSATSRFNADVAHTRLHKTLPASTLMDLCATPSKKPTPPRLPGKDGKDGKVGSPTPSQLICGFFHSTQGCQKDPCDRAHRAPSSQKETKSLESFFKTYKKLTRK